MDKIEVINKDYMELWYHPDSKIVHHKMKKSLPPGGHKKLLSTGADYMEKYGAIKWLSDDRKNAVLTQEDQEWNDKHWRPRVIRAGWQYWALLMPEQMIGKMNMQRIISQKYTDLGITIEFFDNPLTALKWLESQ